MSETLTLNLRYQQFVRDDAKRAAWEVVTQTREIPAAETAIIICDMWDHHWSRGAEERGVIIARKMNDVVRAARDRGVTIIHAPSETMGFYEGSPARQRAVEAPPAEPPTPIDRPDPPLPVDASDGGSDTNTGDEVVDTAAWTRQTEAIEVDEERDFISDNGREVYNVLRHRGIRQAVIMGVHTNMCILGRSFAIKQMVKWGMPIALCRDLTDSMYNPARPPYVSHDEGTRLIIEFIEKFWCPTVLSADLVG